MRSSTAYEAIDDPADPAWHGHAGQPMEATVVRRRILVAMVVVVVAAAAVAAGWVLLGGRGTDGAGDAARSDGPGRELPSAVTAADLPVVDAAPVVDTTASAARRDVGNAVAAAAAAGSGWAPAAATIAPEDLGSGLLEGDMAGIHPDLIRRLDAVAVTLDRELEVLSGWRTRHEQESLYQRYQAGTGNLAAVPGTSLHETGRAADVYVDGVALADVQGARAAAASAGLHFPVAGEAWHVELLP